VIKAGRIDSSLIGRSFEFCSRSVSEGDILSFEF